MGQTPVTGNLEAMQFPGTNHKGLHRDKWFSTRGQSGPPADICQCWKIFLVVVPEVAPVSRGQGCCETDSAIAKTHRARHIDSARAPREKW